MTTINEQNAKQIRKPMEVYVRMDLSDKSITMTYSGYSSAKIADGKLDKTDWKMRKLTDLQGDGYPLDSSCVLYNPSTTASASNGKIGVRGDIGQPVSVTITGSAVMDSAAIIVTGASSVSHDGGTSAIIGSSVIVSIEDSSATLTFTPKSADRRVEISDIIPGIVFDVTNENMISCTLSLRADLSIVDPTLPESEMNLEFYNDEDISEILAAIPEDTPITYRAGYDGDLSPERKFYIADQVTYKDNVVSVHAVDAVHLIRNVDGAFSISPVVEYESINVTDVYDMLKSTIDASEIDAHMPGLYDVYRPNASHRYTLVEDGTEMRQIFADVMNMFHVEGTSVYREVPERGDFWPVYVDAGDPTLRHTKSESAYTIREDECADIERKIDKKISGLYLNNEAITTQASETDYIATPIGKITCYKNGPAYVSFDGYAYVWVFGLHGKDFGDPGYGVKRMIPVATHGTQYAARANSVFYGVGSSRLGFGQSLVGPSTPHFERYGSTYYTQVIPWNVYYDPDARWYDFTSMSGMWSWLQSMGYVAPTDDSLEVSIVGNTLNKTPDRMAVGNAPEEAQDEVKSSILGQVYGSTSEGGPPEEIFPSKSLQSLLDRSPNTGSFTWKGDPRMQPRDVFTFVKLDGTEIDCTIEQIDLEHVGGGTTAKITYREGIV